MFVSIVFVLPRRSNLITCTLLIVCMCHKTWRQWKIGNLRPMKFSTGTDEYFHASNWRNFQGNGHRLILPAIPSFNVHFARCSFQPLTNNQPSGNHQKASWSCRLWPHFKNVSRNSAWNIIALRDTRCVVVFLSNWGALIARINDLTFETTCIYNGFNGGYICVLFVRVQNCECATQKCEYWKI